VAALAARVYQPFDKAYAERNLAAARKAWDWVIEHPDVLYLHDPPGIHTGTYGDKDCGDERLWAAAELWRTTHEEVFERYFLAHYGEQMKALAPGVRPPEWSGVAPFGLWAYVLGGGKDAAAVEAIRSRSVAAADSIVVRAEHNGYRVPLLRTDYVWGSNGIAGNYALQLLVTNAIRPERRYTEAALDTLHYLLGRNTFSLSWVTQLGENPYRHPHHRLNGDRPEPWPGFLSGGPNADREDAAARAMPAGLPPAKVYLDQVASYSTNEIAINWNAVLVFMLAGVMPAR
jgi:endoglucanase